MKLLPLAWIPNQEGFRLIGVQHDNTEIDCVVQLVNGSHTLGAGVFQTLKGWKRIKPTKV